MKSFRFWIWLAGLPWIVACASHPPERSPDTIPVAPDRWTTEAPVEQNEGSTAGTSGTPWWETFGDPRLNQWVERALENNFDLAAAAGRVSQAEALARIAGAPLMPAVSAGFNASRRRQSAIGIPLGALASGGGLGGTASSGPPISNSTTFGLSLDTSWEIDLWGRLHADARAAVARMQASQADYQAAQLSLAAQTAKTWFAVVEAERQVALARRTADSFEVLAGQIQKRYELGVRPSLDLRLARSNAGSAEAAFQQRRAQRDAAIRQLELLVGTYPSATLLERVDGEPIDLNLPAAVPAGIPAEIIRRRPDLKAAERILTSSEEGLVAARRNLYPRLNLTVSGGTLSDQLSDLLDGDFRVWSLLGGLVQPIFQGGRIRGEIARTAGVQEESAARFASAVLRAYGEVETALAAEGYLLSAAHELERTAHELTAARKLAEDRYRSGVGDYLAVLESQTRSFNADSQLLAARRILLDNRVNLHLALGGDFGPDTAPTHED